MALLGVSRLKIVEAASRCHADLHIVGLSTFHFYNHNGLEELCDILMFRKTCY